MNKNSHKLSQGGTHSVEARNSRIAHILYTAMISNFKRMKWVHVWDCPSQVTPIPLNLCEWQAKDFYHLRISIAKWSEHRTFQSLIVSSLIVQPLFLNTIADWFASWQLGFLTCYVSFGAFVFTLKGGVLVSPKTVQGEDDKVLSETVLTASQLRLSGIASYSCQTN